MRSLSICDRKERLADAMRQALSISPTILFLFAPANLFRDQAFLTTLKLMAQGVNIIGCSSAGSISDTGLVEDGFSILSIQFENTETRVVFSDMQETSDSFMAGAAVGELLKGPKLKGLFVLGPGTKVNGTAIVEGIAARLGTGILMSGGLAADDVSFQETFTLANEKISTRNVVAVGFYGDNVSLSSAAEGGWKPFGPARRVTRAQDNVLYELDGRPALLLYKQYLGDKARYLPASGLAYPFAVLRSDRTTSGLIRSALAIDHEREAIILAGNIEQGCRVCLMHADTSALTQGAAQAAAEALRRHSGPEENGCALVVSCVGRKVVLGIDVDDEIEAVTDSFLPNTPIAGFYSYGEINTYTTTGKPELHNQTMAVLYITEAKD